MMHQNRDWSTFCKCFFYTAIFLYTINLANTSGLIPKFLQCVAKLCLNPQITILGNFIRENSNKLVIAFQNIINSYMILKEIEKTNIENIIFIIRLPQTNNNLDYIIRRVFRDLLPLYNIKKL